MSVARVKLHGGNLEFARQLPGVRCRDDGFGVLAGVLLR